MENKNQNLIYTILCACALVIVIGGGYAYFTWDSSKPADTDVTSDQVVDTKKDSVEHKVMKPAIPGDEESKTLDDPANVAPKLDEPKSDESKSDESTSNKDKSDEAKKSDDTNTDKSNT